MSDQSSLDSICEDVRPSFLRARDPSVDRCSRPRPERQVRLFDEIQEEGQRDYYSDVELSTDDEVSTAQSEASSDPSSDQSIDSNSALVYLRLKPVSHISSTYKINHAGNVLVAGPPNDTASTSNNKNKMEQHYSFSAVFDSTVKQDEVYRICIAPRIESADSFVVLTYGTSGSGKTFTLLGTPSDPGIVPRAVENVFRLNASNIYPQPAMKLEKANTCIMDDNEIEREENIRQTLLECCAGMNAEHELLEKTIKRDHEFQTLEQDEVSVFIWISFVEIYNEIVYDLLAPPQTRGNQQMAPPQRKGLKTVINDGKVFLQGLTSVYVKSSAETLKLLQWGLQRVTYASTSINANSSRSHCIFFIDVIKYYGSGLVVDSSYKFCDLAGSERLNKTRNIGSRLTEAKGINTSLMTLGRCLDAANNNKKFKSKGQIIPVRESKLTMLLQAALLGKEKLTMIVNVTPTDCFYEENMNVLRFSAIAKNIIFKQPTKPVNKSRYSFVVEKAKSAAEENIFLRSELERKDAEIRLMLIEQERQLRKDLVESFEKKLTEKERDYQLSLKRETELLQRMFDLKLATLTRKYENQIEDLREQYEEEVEKKRRLTE